jgi:hypothetical protein
MAGAWCQLTFESLYRTSTLGNDLVVPEHLNKGAMAAWHVHHQGNLPFWFLSSEN